MKRLIRIFLFALITGAFAMTSCTYDRDIISYSDTPEGDVSEISFLVDMPQANQVSTRAAGTVAENTIDNIYVLVFDKTTDELISKSRGKNLAVAGDATNDNKVTFKATLPVGKEYTFMILANAESKLTGIDVGVNPSKSKSDVLALAMEETGRWSATSPSIPMWAEKNMTLTASSTPIFELTRMLAKINVEVNLKEIAEGVQMDNFELTSVRYYNYNTAGALVPDENNYNSETKRIIAPTLPTDPKTQTGSALVYKDADITDNLSCKEKIYIFEAAHNGNTYNNPTNNNDWINNPCLVIGGKYRTDNGTWLDETFYRVDFIRKDTSEPGNVKDVWLSILRNFSYNVVITEVSGSGFEDPDIAVKSAPINMEANVLEWNEMDMGEIVFDGVFYLSVSQDQFVFQRNAVDDMQEDNILYVKTDYVYNSDPSDEKSGWKVEKYVDLEGEPVNWLKLNPGKGAPDDRVKAYFTFETNTEDVNRYAVVWIVAGRLRYPVYITQRVLSLEIVDPEDGDKAISEMRFVIPHTGDRTHKARKFKVNWTPTNQPVSITDESPQVWNPFDPGWLTPNPSSSWTIAPGGSETYLVEPPSVSDAELGLDPFYEKETTYTFTVDNGEDRESKSIKLHQIYYNIIVDTYTYKLDGRTYTLSVRSNTNWEIDKIEEWLYNQDPAENPASTPVLLQLKNYDNLRVGTTGGPDVNGSSVAFTVVDQETDAHRNKWGTVYVTFKNPDEKFAPVRVALSFPPASLTILGIGYAVGEVRGFNVGKSSPHHNNSLYDLLANEYNFGSKDESRVQVQRLNIYAQNATGQSSGVPTGIATDEYEWRRGDLQTWLNKYSPDVIVISYSAILREAESKLIMEYLENGGAVIMYYGGDVQTAVSVKPFFDVLFEKSLSYSGASPDLNGRAPGSRVYVTENVDDPILNGPFGDMRNKLWGTHLNTVNLKEATVANDVHILSRTDSEQNYTNAGANNGITGYVNMFRHKKYKLFWIGNAMGTATYFHSLMHTYPQYDPNLVTLDGFPDVRPGFGQGSADTYAKYDVYNSFIFANAMAWAMSVTNHMPPPNGYIGYSSSDY